MTLALGGRCKLHFIQEDNHKPISTSIDFPSSISQDHLVMSWFFNSMEPKIAIIFNNSESSLHLWKAVAAMYGNLNNSSIAFQLKKDLSELQQSNLSKWNELDLYRPDTIDGSTLLKRAEEDKIFQLLFSLGTEYEDLKCHLLMTPELPTFEAVCSVIQREEGRRQVMNANFTGVETCSKQFENRAFATTRNYRGRRLDLECFHFKKIGRMGIGHVKEKCWILHPELKSKFNEELKNPKRLPYSPKVNVVNNEDPSEESLDFTSNPLHLINEFSIYLKMKQGDSNSGNMTAMLGKFAGFLAQSNMASSDHIPGSCFKEDDRCCFDL